MLKLTVAAIALFLSGAAGTQPAGLPADRLLGPMADELRTRVGDWCVNARLRFSPTAAVVTVPATARNRLVGGRWLVTELKGLDERMPFEGIGINGYNPDSKRYEGVWIDGTRGFVVHVEGEYDPGAGIFRTTSREVSRDGRETLVTSETRREGPDVETTRFLAESPDKARFERMVLTYIRAKAANDCR